jgi:cytochrome P450
MSPFGYGARYCLGAPLARIELQTVFTLLVSRFPTLQLAVDVGALTMRADELAGADVGRAPRFRGLRPR